MKHSRFLGASVCFAIFLAGTSGLLADSGTSQPKGNKPSVKEAEDPKEENVYYTAVSGTGVSVTGNKAEFMRRHGMQEGFSGGIEELLIEQRVGKDGLFSVEGRGLFDIHDYEIKLRLDQPEVGHVEAGYEEFRTWYNGAGGYFPGNGQWFSLYDEVLHVDRGEAWFEAQLAMPDLPILTFKYVHEFRRGKKDSVEWGDTIVTGGMGTRKITPTFWQYDETRDIFTGDLKHTLDTTTIESGLKFELSDDKNGHYVTRNPGENLRYLTQHELQTSDLFNYYHTTETWVTEKLFVASGYSYSTMNTHIGGDMIYGRFFDAPFDRTMALGGNDGGYLGLEGGTQWNQHVANFNSMVLPVEDLELSAALRAERMGSDARGNQTDTTPSAAGGFLRQNYTDERSSSDWLKLAQQFEAAYKGLKDWVLFSRAEWEEWDGTVQEARWSQGGGTSGNATMINRDTDTDTLRQKYTLGTNWYPTPQVNLGAQYYHRIRSNSYVNRNDSTRNDSGDAAPAWMNNLRLYTDDVDLRVTWRPTSRVTTVTRYDFQTATIEAGEDWYGNLTAGQSVSHLIGETVTWSPWSCLYLQASFNYTLDTTWTEANSVASSRGNYADSVVTKAENNYWNTAFTTGYALGEKSDLQFTYSYYCADNYRADWATQPYGAGAEEHGLSTAFIHRFTPDILWSLRYGFYANIDETSNHYNDYYTHVVSTDLKIQF